ncbi:MAG: GGDEF domain-containing protein [Parvibaculum sp.]|nr:GGDEF domain-containing protein [Parvibaculum sp.]
MKVGDNRPLEQNPIVARERAEALARQPATFTTVPAPSVGSGRTITDAVSFMGIPATEITPTVRDALMSLMSEVDKLRRDVEKMRTRIREAEKLADHDPMLPVLNRRAFMAELGRVVAYARRYKEPAGLAYLDIDNFKQINDTYGHAAGDAALRHLIEIVSGNVRETDIVGRLGGDEFGVILVRSDEKSAHAKAEALRLLISLHPLLMDGVEIPMSISVGAIAMDGTMEPQAALALADKAMYSAKRQAQ